MLPDIFSPASPGFRYSFMTPPHSAQTGLSSSLRAIEIYQVIFHACFGESKEHSPVRAPLQRAGMNEDKLRAFINYSLRKLLAESVMANIQSD